MYVYMCMRAYVSVNVYFFGHEQASSVTTSTIACLFNLQNVCVKIYVYVCIYVRVCVCVHGYFLCNAQAVMTWAIACQCTL